MNKFHAKKFMLAFLFPLLTAAVAIYAGDDEELSKEKNKKTTKFIFDLLKRCSEKKWCKQFPGGTAGGTVCDPYFKEAVLNPRICCSEGSYHAEMFDEKDKPADIDGMRSYIHLNEHRELNHFTTHIWVKGTAAFNRVGEKIGADLSEEYVSASDEHTSCHASFSEDYNGIPTMMYVCGTRMGYQEFLERMKRKQ